jgi:hypothetical protein
MQKCGEPGKNPNTGQISNIVDLEDVPNSYPFTTVSFVSVYHLARSDI